MMTNWGTVYADAIKAVVSTAPPFTEIEAGVANHRIKCVVEATTAARWMYEKAGFVVQRHGTLEVPEKFSDRPKNRLFFMKRKRTNDEWLPGPY
jgi:hypothetical protein